ncbi:DNA replication/repair protein RecF [Novosphingopyxis sp.]|uniref:DNA replication/repair protein RecF n=1 Tax=Novosphingopyxis sp. TaxID=2709690 RepID=UPI003B5CBB0A
MSIARLSLTDFRNHARLEIAARPGFVLLTGPNGAGKTNVLEAISMLSPGRGLRRAALSVMAREKGPGGFSVFAQLDDASLGAAGLGVGTEALAPERKKVRINGAQANASQLAEWLALIWLTPAMDRLFVEGAAGRRRFVDRLALALTPGHAAATARYERAMRERNRLLGSDRPDPSWFDALELQMAEHGAAIGQARARLIRQLGERLAGEPESPFARPSLALEGGGPIEASALEAALRAGRPADRAAGRSLVGPHRVDLRVRHAAKDCPAQLCSTGEQKALLLAIVLAHADAVADARAMRPILLLDEVAAHLDPLRRAALFERLHARGGQVWMTGTEPAPFAPIAGEAVHLALG